MGALNPNIAFNPDVPTARRLIYALGVGETHELELDASTHCYLCLGAVLRLSF